MVFQTPYPLNENTLYYGSKKWADCCLRLEIAECKNLDRVRFARLMEIDYFINELKSYGWSWHSKILRSWKHRFWSSLQPSKEADSIKNDGGIP